MDERERTETVSQTYDWYSEGEGRTVEVAGIVIVVKFVGRKGRRARIAIAAPGGAVFSHSELRSDLVGDGDDRNETC